MGQYWLGKNKPKQTFRLSDQPENAFIKVAIEFYLMEFSTNCLSN